ncbi:MAG: hypothetical protein BWY93_00316 [Euryarchaeota archaeon ADurb.BinA087]|nr:MAG: hypothetical protein BWY93_00316 [Euryarchaeota archaeon ADurb.BinA087]
MIPESPGIPREYGLAPIVGVRPVVLILGSFPSKMSIRRQEYYANPQNQFWRIIADLLNKGERVDIPSLERILTDHHIALWDVIASRRYQKGSMDCDIIDPAFNDIPAFLAAHTTIRYIGINGGKAWVSFQQLVRHDPIDLAILCTQLPSTSPAYAACRYDQKLSQWRTFLEGRERQIAPTYR